MGKIVSKDVFQTEIRPRLKEEKKKIALCHGVFDLVHPGHIIHLQQAKEMADVLVVSITASKFVRKGPGRPYFDDEMRQQFLAAVGCIDYVMLSEGYAVDDIVECVKPDFYVKGEEYSNEKEDVTGKITAERELVEKYGGVIRYTSGQVFSSTKLINTAMTGLPDNVLKYMEDFIERYTMADIKKYSEKAKSLRVLILGDIIVDKYTYCSIQGLMSKDTGYSARINHSEEYLGGSVAVARHLRSFTENVTLMSIIGNEERIRLRMFDELADRIQLKLTYSADFPTIIKHRYLEKDAKREEYHKIFAVNNIPVPALYDREVKEEFKHKLEKEVAEYDVIFLCDFGHGLVDDEIKDIVQKKAKYLVLNCQTNSSNYGMNIITKYERADVFSLDQRELRLAIPTEALDEAGALRKLRERLHGNGWLTRGSMGAYGIEQDEIYECPAFTLNVKDTVGAGDAFFSVAGLYTAAGAPIEVGTFMGNISGALAANIVGNKDAVEKVNVLKYASTLMNV